MGFLTLAYYPEYYDDTQIELEQVHQLCVDWKFPRQSAIVVRKLIELRQSQIPRAHQMILKGFVVHHVYDQLRQRRQRTRSILIEEEFDDNSSDSDTESFIEDDES